ncbi:MAG TPA: hypothetical protein VFP33_12280 [Gallionella sp.]|nr:hypothetical protein [Gallionella sp.]
MNTDVTGLLWRDLEIFLLIGSMFGVVLALLMILRPQLLPVINRVANHWLSMRHTDRVLDKVISIDPWFYQHHRPLGILIALGASYFLVYFGYFFDKRTALQGLAGYVPVVLLDEFLDILVIASVLGGSVALIVGLFLWFRPNLLHGIEKTANLWVSSRRATKVLSVPHDQFDRYVESHARLAGWFLLLGSSYLLTAIVILLA